MHPNDLVVSTTGADAAGAFAILATIADADASRRRLEELRAERVQTEAALAETRALNDAMVNAREATVREVTEARELAEANAVARAELQARAAEIEALSDTLAREQENFNAALLARGAEWDRREQAVLAREVAAAAREKRIGTQEAAAQALIDQYTGKIAALKQLAG